MRSMQKAIEQFNRISKDDKYDFAVSDIQQIYEKGSDPWDWITDALRAGFAIGWRSCKSNMKKASTSAATLTEADQ